MNPVNALEVFDPPTDNDDDLVGDGLWTLSWPEPVAPTTTIEFRGVQVTEARPLSCNECGCDEAHACSPTCCWHGPGLCCQCALDPGERCPRCGSVAHGALSRIF